MFRKEKSSLITGETVMNIVEKLLFILPTRYTSNRVTLLYTVDSSTVICWMSPFVILEILGLFCHILFLMKNPVSKQCSS